MRTASEAGSKEQQIMTLMRGGDQQFLDLLYKEYGGILFKISLGIVKSHAEAEDVLQESLVKIWKSAKSFDSSKAKLITWIVQIAKNTALDHLKSKAGKNAKLTDTIADRPVTADLGVSRQNEDYIGVRETIDASLEQRDKTILDMIYFQGYTQKEVAEKMDMPLGSVKTRIRLTVNQLRELLKERK